MGAKDYAGDIARALAFLSRLPLPQSVFDGPEVPLGRLARAFPAAGVLIAAPSALLALLLALTSADPLMTALLAIGLQCLITGALHEDGLSDTADGLGGGRDRDHALIIMKDSRIGTYGAIALVLSLALRAAALAAIIRHVSPLAAALALPAAATLSRGAMVWHWAQLPPAKTDGVAAGAGQPQSTDARVAIATSFVLAAAALVLPAARISPLIAAVLVAFAACAGFTAYVRHRIQGHTGDTIGATQQICEIAVFCVLALFV